METPTEADLLDNTVYEAGLKAKSEASMVSSQAQRLFYEYWNGEGHSNGLQAGIDQFKKCMRMAEEIRKIVTDDFTKRIKEFDGEAKDMYAKAGIEPIGARDWATWRPQGMEG